MSLNGKQIAVLGGSSGIGFAVAQAAVAEGARVTIASSNPGRVEHAAAALGGDARGTAVDLLDAGAITAFFERQGPIDHLVYTAGETLRLSPLDELDLEVARGFFELRYWGAFAAAKAAHRLIRPGGSIVFTSGVAAARPRPGWSAASSICAAMEGLTRALAVELAPIRVNIVSPAVVKTPLWAGMDEAAREGLYAEEARRLPVGHVGEPEEIAEAYLYLMGQTYVTGQVLTVDGGALLV